MIKTKITVLVDNISLLLIEKEKIYVKSRILNSEKLQSLDEKTFNKIECLLPENITLFRLSNFLESRCISKHDKGLDYWLKKYDIHSWSPFWICRKTHGVRASDSIWLDFDYEYEDATDK